MSLPKGHSLSPTPLSHDQFTIRPAKLSRSARRFLKLATAEDAATARFARSLEHFTGATPAAAARSAGRAFANAVNRGLVSSRSVSGR